MRSTPLHTSAYAARAILLLALSTTTTTVYADALTSMTYVGCFSSSQPLSDEGSYTYQTSGYCQPICVGQNQAVLGLTGGSDCWCGDLLPPTSSQVDDSNCNTPCNGYNQEMCGGDNYWTVYLTGIDDNVANYGGGDSSSSSSTSTASAAPATTPTPTPTLTTPALGRPPPGTSIIAKPSVVTEVSPGRTVVVTQTPSSTLPSNSNNKSSGTNTVGIAVGVVVGVVLAAALIAGLFFFIRHRRRRAAEEEYARNHTTDFGKPPPTGYSNTSDSRLDPEAGNRRNSVGSIADAGDYSRKILRVANPDR